MVIPRLNVLFPNASASRVVTGLLNSFKKIDFYVYKSNKKMTDILLKMNGKIIKDSDDEGEMTIRVEK